MALTTSLISHWKLDEASGTRNDSHGSNHLTDNNTVAQVAGKIGNAASMVAGNSESLSIAASAALGGRAGDFAMAGWVKPVTGISTNEMFWTSANGSGQRNFHLRWVTGNLARAIAYNGAGTQIALVSQSITLDAWGFVYMWYEHSTLTWGLSVNNNAAATVTASVAIGTGAYTFSLGSEVTTTFCTCQQDSVSRWDRLLTVAERNRLYNGGNGLDYPHFDLSAAVLSNHYTRLRRGA